MDRGIVGLRRVAVEHADRHRELRVFHRAQQVGEHAVGLVVDQDVVLGDAVLADGHDFEAERIAVEPESPVAVLAEDQLLAVLHQDLRIGGGRLVGPARKRPVVVYDAVLDDLDERCAAMGMRPLENPRKVLLVGVDRARDEAGAGAEREHGRVDRRVDRALRGRGRPRAEPRGRRVLPLGEAVDFVVEQQHLDVDVAPDRVQRVVAADRQAVAVAHHYPDVEVGVGELGARRDGGRAAVDRVEAVGRHIVREARGAADAGDEHHVFRRELEVGHRALNRLDDRVVAAARAPANLLVRRIVGGLQLLDGGLDVHASSPGARGSPLRGRKP